MKNITIQIDGVALETLCEYLMFTKDVVPESAEQKAVSSIMDGVLIKLRKKSIDKEGVLEKFKLKWKYHEGFALLKACQMALHESEGYEYVHNVILRVSNQINEQL